MRCLRRSLAPSRRWAGASTDLSILQYVRRRALAFSRKARHRRWISPGGCRGSRFAEHRRELTKDAAVGGRLWTSPTGTLPTRIEWALGELPVASKELRLSAQENPRGLDEQQVREAMEFAAGIQGFAGGDPDKRSQRLARRILRGTSTPEAAVRRYLDATLPEVE